MVLLKQCYSGFQWGFAKNRKNNLDIYVSIIDVNDILYWILACLTRIQSKTRNIKPFQRAVMTEKMLKFVHLEQ
ncbi:MAG TPA: hypothetical protein DCM48_17420, partial [Thalassospira sp.]|nr:hypothetical protein [Thalassospira sp.]